MEEKIIVSELTTVKNKMEIEKLVFPSLQHEELTEEKINQFVDTMTRAYDFNINVIKSVIEKMESKLAEKGGK